MITIVYSTHKDPDYNYKFKKHLLDTVGLKDVQILEYVNHNQFSLSQIYNSGLTESIYNIVCCVHNDIKLEKNWGKKLLSDFESNDDFGIIGKAGSCYFPESGVYWEKLTQTMVGQVYHHPDGQKKWVNKYSPKLPFLIPVVTIDGLFISFDKRKIKHTFDESYGKFHFYDHGFCIPNYIDNVKIGVTSSFEITHHSVGKPNEEFFESKNKFTEKWGKVLPLDLKPSFPYSEKIKKFNNKKGEKIAIIIPTKNKIDMLIDCINSFYNNCDNEWFDIFIADTGSYEDEKNKLKKFIETKSNIKLIEYDYYNFAKINNDVVKKYITEKYEYILFSNNDIKILNDVISGMLETFKSNPKAGTVGCRLHFADNTIQHDGVIVVIKNENSQLIIGHSNFMNYYNYKNNTNEVFGNTAGLLMIRRKTFIESEMFNEDFLSCFEDVDLNVKLLCRGFKNYICGKCVAYHYESQTRNEDEKKEEKMKTDYTNMVNILYKNINKIKNHFIIF